jgi:hypothetical protein
MTEDRAPYHDVTPGEADALRERLERDIENLIEAFKTRTDAVVIGIQYDEWKPRVRVQIAARDRR